MAPVAWLALTAALFDASVARGQEALLRGVDENTIVISGLFDTSALTSTPLTGPAGTAGAVVLQGDLAQKLMLRDADSGNRLTVRQSGVGNTALVSGQGANNSIQITQAGLRNFAQIAQSGVMNSVSIQQGAW